MKKLILPSIVLLLSGFYVYSQGTHADKALLNVVTEFQDAIREKDSLKFKKLFFHDSVPFTGIMSNLTEQSIKNNYPEFEGISVSNSSKFIREICLSDKDHTEKMYDIKLSTDGNVASISFYYSYKTDDKMIQWGNESWNLVFVDKTWLITDVVYSIRFPKIEPFPYSEFE